MRRRQQRHPVLDTVVYAAAFMLLVFIARELWLRRPTAPLESSTAVIQPFVLHAITPPLPQAARTSRTEVGMTGVAPIKLTRIPRRKHKTTVVPAP